MQAQISRLKELIAMIEEDTKKALAGNRAAGTRARSGLQQMKQVATNMRKDIISLRQKD